MFMNAPYGYASFKNQYIYSSRYLLKMVDRFTFLTLKPYMKELVS